MRIIYDYYKLYWIDWKNDSNSNNNIPYNYNETNVVGYHHHHQQQQQRRPNQKPRW